MLTAEEQALNLTQPHGVGQRPRPCNVESVKEEESFSPSFLSNTEGKIIKKPIGSNLGSSFQYNSGRFIYFFKFLLNLIKIYNFKIKFSQKVTMFIKHKFNNFSFYDS